MNRVTTLAAVVMLAACARGENTADTTAALAAPTASPEAKAAAVSNAIAANPAAADSILTANGYTRESFEREIFAIAADSARSATYAAAKAP